MSPTGRPHGPAWFDISTPTRREHDTSLARAERLGGRRVLDPVDTPVSRIAVFTDPDGNRIGLVSR
jgi:predicted enzyme related to lactoylglutathione lyase